MKKTHDLSQSNSVAHDYMKVLRNVVTQNNRERFRLNVKKLGMMLGFELSKSLSYSNERIETPLEEMDHPGISDDVVVITILRAGLPLHEGIVEVFPECDQGFVSAYRKHEDDGFRIELEYVACPSIEGKVLILNDPMLATGRSMIDTWKMLLQFGQPKHTHIVSVIASEEGVSYVQDNAPGDYDLWVGAIDSKLNENKYIVPGLGDAGDLAFGPKLQH